MNNINDEVNNEWVAGYYIRHILRMKLSAVGHFQSITHLYNNCFGPQGIKKSIIFTPTKTIPINSCAFTSSHQSCTYIVFLIVSALRTIIRCIPPENAKTHRPITGRNVAPPQKRPTRRKLKMASV